MTSDQHPPPSKSGPSASSGQSSLAAFWAELKRRKVMRVAITYAVVAWLIIQIAEATFENFGIPVWAFRFVTLMVLLGFPIALILAWAFELTPEGIKTTRKAVAERGDAPVSEKQQRKRNWTAYAVGAALPTVIFGALALFFYIRSHSSPDPSHSIHGVIESDKSIAVLPLENMSPDPDNAFFADGVQEDILTNLAKVEALRVIARTSTLQYRGTVKTVQAIGQELGVSYLVEGSVRRAANRVKVTVQLVDCSSGDHLWADDYDRNLDDIFAIQAEVAKEIAQQLRAVLSPDEIEKIEYRPTENQEAYDNFIKFRNLIASGEFGTMEKKIAFLEEAVRLDPNFTEAWARLAVECIFFWQATNREDPKLRTRAYEAIEQAKLTGPDKADIPYAMSSFAFREDMDPEASISYLLQALSIDPKLPLLHWRLGSRYRYLGRLSEAQHHLETELRIDPVTWIPNYLLVWTYVTQGLWEKAETLVIRNIERTEQSRWSRMLYEVRFLKSGSLDGYAESFELLEEFGEVPQQQLARALLDRNYIQALELVQDLEEDLVPFDANWLMGFSISHPRLVTALIRFDQNNRENVLPEVMYARNYFDQIVKENPVASPTYWSQLSVCFALEGNGEEMVRTMEKAREISKTPYYKFNYQIPCEMHIAIAYLVLGDHDRAIETLEAASKMDSPIFLNRELDLWFIFDRLRGNPRFDALLKD